MNIDLNEKNKRPEKPANLASKRLKSDNRSSR